MSNRSSIVAKYPDFCRSALLAIVGLIWLWAGAWVVAIVGISDDFALGLAGFISYVLLWILPTAGVFILAGLAVNKGLEHRMQQQGNTSPQP
jgi:hypothetical protein